MKTLRWLSFVPVAALLSVACGYGIGGLFPSRSFSQSHFILSLASPRGLAPQILERLLPVTLFILVGGMIAPGSGRKAVVVLGVLGGLFGWPFGPQYSLAHGYVFYAAGSAGTLIGCALGLLLAFQWRAKRRKAEPIQLLGQTSGLAPNRGPL